MASFRPPNLFPSMIRSTVSVARIARRKEEVSLPRCLYSNLPKPFSSSSSSRAVPSKRISSLVHATPSSRPGTGSFTSSIRANSTSTRLFNSRRDFPRTVESSYATGRPVATFLSRSGVRSTPRWESVGQRRWASQKSSYKTVQQQRARYRSGPFSWKAGLLFIVTGIGLIIYFRMEKARIERKRVAEATKGIGKPKVGGSFDLVDQDGQRFTQENLKGKYALVYFGFTHCPDICPDELDKMAKMIDLVRDKAGNVLRPIFISCDPARDTPAVVKSYLREFHPDLIGLTGEYEQVKATCKAYRVYFSTPPDVKSGQDYLVDHSIYFYLMDPEGDFVECIGRQHTAEEGAKLITDHIKDWKGNIDRS